MTKLHLNEAELAKRWGLSPKTLQRWRCEGRGPAYLKLSKRVTYAIEDVVAFEVSQKRVRENSHEIAALRAADPASAEALLESFQRVSQAGNGGPSDSPYITDIEAARATKLPQSWFTYPAKRADMQIPHYFVGKHVRFMLEEIRQWEILHTQRGQVKQSKTDRIAAIFEGAIPATGATDPENLVCVPGAVGPTKMTLKDAFRLINTRNAEG